MKREQKIDASKYKMTFSCGQEGAGQCSFDRKGADILGEEGARIIKGIDCLCCCMVHMSLKQSI